MAHIPFRLPMGPPPPLINPPPQIFGSFMPEGLPNFPPELAAQMFGDAMLDDFNDPKRRRIARACDMCRKKKIKCDGKMPLCTHCINYKTECVFTHVEKKRAPPKGAKYIEALENRLGRMESLLRLSGLLNDEDGDVDLGMLEKKLAEQQARQSSQAASSSIPASPGHFWKSEDNPETPHSSLSPGGPGGRDERQHSLSAEPSDNNKPGEVEALSEMMCSLVTSKTGDTNYTGSASAFSIFSPKGIQWVNEKTGNDSFKRVVANVSIDSNKWTNWKPEVFTDLFARPTFIPLPEKKEALMLVSLYFDHLNTMFPLFHRPTFMHLFERQYSNDPYEGPGWWASLNAVFATAHRMSVMSGFLSRDEDHKSWAFIKNAMGVFTELAMRSTDLLGAQALLCMALFMQGTPNPQPSFMLLAAAIRLSHNIGLHKRGTGFNLNPIEHEQRKRVFWIAYVLDKDMCLRNGRPPAQDDDDVNVELPDPDPEDGIGNIPLPDGKGKLNMFRTVCEFAVIESKVYKQLYASRATRQSDGELLQTIGDLDRELEDWKDRIPIEFRPEHEIKASHTPLMLHIVMLHFSYYNCLTTLHRMSVHHGYWTSRLSDYALKGLNAKPLNPRVYSSAALCTAAARASISLLKYVPANDASCVWMILYFPVSALVTLFGHILQNPLDPRAQSDIKLMGLVITFFHSLGQEEAETGGVQRMLSVCVEFERVARIFVAQADKEAHPRRKRKNLDISGPNPPPQQQQKPNSQQQQQHQKQQNQAQQHQHTQQSSQHQHNPPQQSSQHQHNPPQQNSQHQQSTSSPQASHQANTPLNMYSPPSDSRLSPLSHTAYGSSPAQSPQNMDVMGVSQHSQPQQPQQHSLPHPPQPQHTQHSQLPHQHPQPQQHHTPSLQYQQPRYTTAYQHMPQPISTWSSVQDFNLPGQPDYLSFADLTGFGPNGLQNMDWDVDAPGLAPIGHVPFPGHVLLPQDLTSLPMSMDWDWAEMSGGAYPSVENGNFGMG